MEAESGLSLYLWTAVVGALLLVLYYVVSDFVKEKPKEAAPRTFEVSLEEVNTAEVGRDFLRNIKAVEVFDGQLRSPLEPVLRGAEDREGEDVEPSALLEEYLKGKGYEKPDDLVTKVMACLCVNLSMQVLEAAELSPPAMYQPRFTLALMENSVFVVVHAFVGSPVLGPPHPDKKYTKTQLSYATCNLLQKTRVHQVSFKLKPTTKLSMDIEELHI